MAAARITGQRATWALAIVAVAALLAWWLWPEPIVVETAQAARGTVAAIVEEDGEARARDRYGVAAPVGGRLLRIELREGDPVKAGQVVARIAPAPLAAAEREQLEARLTAARAVQREAQDRVHQADAALEQAKRDRARTEDLVARRFLSEQALEQARLAERTREEEQSALRARSAATAADAQAAQATLAAIRRNAPLVPVAAPVAGFVLRIAEKSERVVGPGTLLLTVGDPAALEMVVDVLSTDAMRIRPGMKVTAAVGGGQALQGAVRVVEPAAFTKVSALGVEEQRVNVVVDVTGVPPGVGDGYRVDARIVLAEKADALVVPAGALFRRGPQWAVYQVEEGRARLRTVETGIHGPHEVEVVSGLARGDTVVLYPGNELEEGARVTARPRAR